jgi:hypothetical protein
MKVAEISKVNAAIAAQGGWERFWNNDGNIERISHSLVKASSVHQSTLDMIQLLMGAAAITKMDNNKIQASIDVLMESNRECSESYNYLLHIKQAFEGIRRRDQLVESLISHDKDTTQQINYLYTNQSELRSESDSIKLNLAQLREASNNLSDWSNKLHSFISSYIAATQSEMAIMSKNEDELKAHLISLQEKETRFMALESSFTKNMKFMWGSICITLTLIVAVIVFLLFRQH